jgi:hypothetical protein
MQLVEKLAYMHAFPHLTCAQFISIQLETTAFLSKGKKEQLIS